MDNRTCINCVWCKKHTESSPVGCYFNGKFVKWLDRHDSEMFPICLIPNLADLKHIQVNARWTESYTNQEGG
jgi:hypothetical protein